MAFGYIKYSTDENMGFFGLVKKLMGKSKIEKMPGFGDDGLLITLPYGKYEENIKLRERANKNIFKILEKMDIEFISGEENINYPYGFKLCKGNLLKGAFAEEIIKDISQKENVYIENTSLIIKDGGDEGSIYAIEDIAKIVGEMAVFTERQKGIENLIEDIYFDTGLSISLFSYEESDYIKESMFIVSCKKSENNEKALKKGSIYLFLFGNDQKAQELYEKRKDINVYYDPEFTFNGKNQKASVIEAYLLSSIMNGDSDKKRFSLKEYAAQNTVKYAEIKALKAL